MCRALGAATFWSITQALEKMLG